MNKKDEDKKSAELRAMNAKLYQEEQEKEAALKQKKAEDSFYQKLSDVLTLMFWLWEIQSVRVLVQKQMCNSGLNSYNPI